MNPEPPIPMPVPEPPPPSSASWLEKLAAVLFCILCIEMGAFLLVCPWLDGLWTHNRIFLLVPAWRPFLMGDHFRGAVSGLGLLNIFIGFYEAVRLRRFARPRSGEGGSGE
jgi:hypothetical protein